MRNLQENSRIFVKISVIFKSVCLNNDRAITQNTPKCVENCSDDQLSYICSSTYYQFFCNPDYNSENSVFWSDTGPTLVLGYVHKPCPILTIKTQQYMCKIDAV